MKQLHLLGASLMLICMVSAFSVLPTQPTKAASPYIPRTGPEDTGLCPPLSAPTGNIINVSTVSELQNAVNAASSGDTILIANGTYNLNGVYLRIETPNVTLRSQNGNRDAYTATAAFSGGAIYFALKTEGVGGESDPSNNAFWPSIDVYLPIIIK